MSAVTRDPNNIPVRPLVSEVAGNVADAVDVETHELSVNILDKKIFVKDSAGNQKLLSVDPAASIEEGDQDKYITGEQGFKLKVRQAATRAVLSAFDTNADVYLEEKGFDGWFEFLTGDQSALRDRDPFDVQGMFVPVSTDLSGASGGWLRKGDPLHLNIGHFGGFADHLVNSADGVIIQQGTDLADALDAVIAWVLPSEDRILPSSNQIAKMRAYTLDFERHDEGMGRFWASRKTIFPNGKLVTVDGKKLATVAIDSALSVGDYVLEFAEQGQGAVFGVRNMVFLYAGFRIVGSSNGHEIINEHNLFIKTRAPAVHTVDREVLYPAITGGGGFNLTQFEWSNLTFYGCNGSLDLDTRTYSVVTISRLRHFASTGTCIRTTGSGYIFVDCENLGMFSGSRTTSTFLHLDPKPGTTVSNVHLHRDQRFGSEDTRSFDDNNDGTSDLYEPPQYLVVMGPMDEVWDSTKRVTNCSFNGVQWNGTHATSNENGNPFLADGVTANPDYAPVLSAIKINCRYNNISIVDGNRDEFPDGFIDDRVAKTNGWNTFGNVFDMEQTGTAAGTLFATSSLGWTVKAPAREAMIPVRPFVRFSSDSSAITFTDQSGFIRQKGDLIEVNMRCEFSIGAANGAANGSTLLLDFDVLNADGTEADNFLTADNTIFPNGQPLNVVAWAGVDLISTSRDIVAFAQSSSMSLQTTTDNGVLANLTKARLPDDTTIMIHIVGEYFAA